MYHGKSPANLQSTVPRATSGLAARDFVRFRFNPELAADPNRPITDFA